MTDQQTVVDTTKTAAQPDVADASARDDADQLDKLLAEFDQGTKPAAVTPPETKSTPQPTIDPEFATRVNRIEQRLFQDDVNETVSKIFGDMKVPRRVAVGWLDQVARESPQVAQAFMNKANDPKTWARFEKSLAKEALKDFKSDIDEPVTADTAAVAAAVRGASAKVEPEAQPNLGQMSDAELRNWRMKTYGF